ncbi:MAG: hypothetical protein ACXVQY_05910 [Actinomycetota bacterium]
MKRTIGGVVLVAVGAAFIIATFTSHLFTVAPAFERMTKDFRPQMTTANIQALRGDLSQLTAVQDELVNKVVPAVATAVKMTPEQFIATMQTQFPAVTAGMTAIPQISTQFSGVLNTLQNEQARFAKADAIPTSNLPATTVPWTLLFAGVITILVGLAVIRVGKTGPILAIVVGVLLVVAPLAMSFPSKASAADTMNKNLKPVYTAQLVAGAKQSLGVMQQMGSEMQTKMIPALGTMLNMQPADVQTYLAKNFPVVAAGMTAMPGALTRFGTMVTTFDRSLANYDTAKGTALTPLVWLMIGGGLVCAAVGVVTSYRKQTAEVEVHPISRAA